MTRKRFIAGLIFGLFMMICMFILQYATADHPGNEHFVKYLKPAIVAGILSGIIFGSLLGKLPKKKYD